MKVIVVGAGIVGASSAYHLARQGVEVVIVDKSHQGQATAAGAGIVCPWLSSPKDENWYRLAKESARYYPTLISRLEKDGESDVGYGRVGALSVSSNSEELDRIEKRVRERALEAPEVGEISRLTAKQAKDLFPPLDENLAAVHVPGAARVDGRLLRDALLRAAEKHGAVRRTGEARLETKDDQVVGVNVDGEVISADTVVAAAGAWIADLLRPLDIGIPVEPQRGQIVHLKLRGQNTSQWPVILPESSHYMVAFDDSRVVVGATRETGSGFDYRVTAGGIEEVIREALSVAPGLSDGELYEVRIGFRPMGPDNLPLLGQISNIPRLIIANGLGASGLTMGPYVGHLAAEMSVGSHIGIDLASYSPDGKIVKA